MTLSVLSLCTGFAGLDHAIEEVLADTELAYVADPGAPIGKKGGWDFGPKILLKERYPHVPNLGDITKVDWWQLVGVDIVAAGFPCTDISNAGLRAGIEGERSGIWANVADAIRVLRPRLVVLENVAALLGRGMGRVLGDLSEIGYDARWTCVRASDIGAPHRRERVFIVAEPADSDGSGWRSHLRPLPAWQPDAFWGSPDGVSLPTPKASDGDRRDCESERGRHSPSLVSVGALLPTPTAALIGNRLDTQISGDGREVPNKLGWAVSLLPTPTASDGTGAGHAARGGRNLRTEVALLPTPTTQNSHGNHVNNRGNLLLPGAVALLPTPCATDGGFNKSPSPGAALRPSLRSLAHADRWGDFGPAIAGWEIVMGRPAPEATEPGATPGKRRLSPRFVEWLMGCDDGWVTDLIAPNRDPRPGRLSRNSALRLLGNGVVKQQGAYALWQLLAGVS